MSANTDTPRPGARVSLVLATCGFFLITLDVTIVNLALPSIQADLGGDTSAQQWVLDGYTLFFAALLLFAGNICDRFGANRAYVAGISLFLTTSLLCALAPTMAVLIGARCAQGFGAAIMLPASMTLVREVFPDPAARARALGVWAAGGAIAASVGPVLGGTLSAWDWRLVFLVNVPVCAAMLIAAARAPTSPHRRTPFDWTGQILMLIGLGALIYALIEGGEVGYDEPVIIGLFVAGLVALVAFFIVQARVSHPMLPLTLFRPRAMRAAMFGGFAFMFSLFGSVFISSLYLQQELELSSALAGLVLVPSALFGLIGNLGSGPVVNRFGPRFAAALGMASLLIGLIGLNLSAPSQSPFLVGLFMTFIGIGGSVSTPSLANVVLASAPTGYAGVASAASNTFRQVGGALAIAVFGVLLAGTGGFVVGMQQSLTAAAGIAAVALVLCAALPGANSAFTSPRLGP